VPPVGFEVMKTVRAKTYFGSDAHVLCTCVARSTGLRCQNPAVRGARTCRVHGGTGGGNKRVKRKVSDAQAAKRYFATVAVLADLSDVVSKDPKSVKEIMEIERLGARGRKIHEVLNKK
jgi:hypothetical protein